MKTTVVLFRRVTTKKVTRTLRVVVRGEGGAHLGLRRHWIHHQMQAVNQKQRRTTFGYVSQLGLAY